MTALSVQSENLLVASKPNGLSSGSLNNNAGGFADRLSQATSQLKPPVSQALAPHLALASGRSTPDRGVSRNDSVSNGTQAVGPRPAARVTRQEKTVGSGSARPSEHTDSAAQTAASHRAAAPQQSTSSAMVSNHDTSTPNANPTIQTANPNPSPNSAAPPVAPVSPSDVQGPPAGLTPPVTVPIVATAENPASSPVAGATPGATDGSTRAANNIGPASANLWPAAAAAAPKGMDQSQAATDTTGKSSEPAPALQASDIAGVGPKTDATASASTNPSPAEIGVPLSNLNSSDQSALNATSLVVASTSNPDPGQTPATPNPVSSASSASSSNANTTAAAAEVQQLPQTPANRPSIQTLPDVGSPLAQLVQALQADASTNQSPAPSPVAGAPTVNDPVVGGPPQSVASTVAVANALAADNRPSSTVSSSTPGVKSNSGTGSNSAAGLLYDLWSSGWTISAVSASSGSLDTGAGQRDFASGLNPTSSADPASAAKPDPNSDGAAFAPVQTATILQMPHGASGTDQTVLAGPYNLAATAQERASATWQAIATPAERLVNNATLNWLQNGAEMRVQLRTDAFGPMEIQATLASGKIGASIGVEGIEAQKSLLNQLPALHQVLMERNVQVDRLVVVANQGQAGAGLGSNSQQSSSEPYSVRKFPATVAESSVSGLEPPVAAPGSAQSHGAWGRLNIRV